MAPSLPSVPSASSSSGLTRGTHFPSFSRSPPRSPRQTSASPIASTSSSISSDPPIRTDSPSAPPLGRGRGLSGSATNGVQSRRSAVSLGLGVSFAPLLSDLSSPSSSSRATSPNSAVNSPSPQRAYSPRPESAHSTASTRAHSRHGSFSTTSGTTMPVGAGGAPGTSTRPSSRLPSRRPSLSHLASFLSGIEHHARVRDPGPNGGRGVSRSASRSQSRAGERRLRGYDLDTDDDEEDGLSDRLGEDVDDEASSSGVWSSLSLPGRRRTGSQASSVHAASRRSSVNYAHAAGDRGNPHPLLHSLVRENTNGGVTSPISIKSPPSSNGGSSGWGRRRDAGDVDDDDDGSALGDKTATPVSRDTAASRMFKAPPTPRILSTEMDEEPFIDTAPNSPLSINKRNHSFAALGEGHDPAVVEEGGLSNVEVFEEGERVGVDVWLEGRGGWVRDCFGSDTEGGPGNGIGGPRELEIERRLGEGTYAIVYLVREILYDPNPNSDDDLLSPIDPATSFQFDLIPSTSHSDGGRPRMRSWASDPFRPPAQPTYGKHFALKCLCKKDLTDELIEVQRGEAVLHRALPDHEYIVRLYGAYETDDWLFLVLEYCPGRDLFYWLLESQQHQDGLDSCTASPHRRNRLLEDDDLEGALSRTITAHNALDRIDETPPSPSLLSSTDNSHLLSRKRLRLISRMFGQMCQAVQACHDAGIAHRDIKPENFIVMDGRMDGEGSTGSRVVVKITDWGLGTRETECEDFDCGSKPYMAYECRNNLAPAYDPRQADVWSLGLVLLNLLYHRNPWADPSLDDPDFADYVQDGRAFLQSRFEGMSDEVAAFLTDRVFCDVLEKEEDGQYRRRVSAGEFGKWAGRLVIMLGGDHKVGGNPFAAASLASSIQPAAAISEHTFERITGVTPKSPVLGGGPPAMAASLLSQFAPRPAASVTSGPPSTSTVWTPHLMEELPSDLREELPKVVEEPEREAIKEESTSSSPAWQPPPLSPQGFSDDESLPSPSFSPPFAPTSIPLPPPTPVAPLSPSVAPMVLPVASPTSISSDSAATRPDAPFALLATGRRELSTNGSSSKQDGSSRERSTSAEGPDDEENERSAGASEKPKRRKRGARKSKTTRVPGDTSPPTPSPLSPGSPSALATVDEGQDQLLQDLASASQNLARELSKTPRSYSAHGPRSSRHSSSYQQTSSATSIRSNGSSVEVTDSLPKKPAKSGGVFGRFKTLVTDGNPDLEAFKQRAAERNASIGAKADTYSAPAKMQGARRQETPLSSRGSFGTASWGSNWSAEGDDAPRGRSGTGGEMSPGHWSSTSSRRERLDKQRRRTGEGDLSPSSSSRNGTATSLSTATFDSRTHTPLSSFSSVNTDASVSTHGFQANQSIATVRDWRNPSPHPSASERPYSGSRSRAPTSESVRLVAAAKEVSTLSPSLPIGSRPRLVDMATDTSDLVVPTSPTPSTTSTATLAPPPLGLSPTTSGPKTNSADPIVRPWSASAASSRVNSGTTTSSLTIVETARAATPTPPITAPSTTMPAAAAAPPVKAPNKLAKMLTSISVFNRSATVERPASAGT